MEEKKNKKAIISIVIGVLVLVALIISAAYAYYVVTGNNTTTTTAGRVTLEKAGVVSLIQGVSNIYLDVTAAQMSQSNSGTDYYGMTTQTTASTEAQNHIFATVSATGGETDTIYECTMGYTISASQISGSSNSAYAALGWSDAELILTAVPTANSGNYSDVDQQVPIRFLTQNTINDYNTFIIYGNTSIQIVGDLVLHNLNENQNDLAELGINFSFQATSFSCNPVEVTMTSNDVDLIIDHDEISISIANNESFTPFVLNNSTFYYAYKLTPNGKVSAYQNGEFEFDSDDVLLAKLINNSDDDMYCYVGYSLQTTGNLLEELEELNDTYFDYYFNYDYYDDGIPSTIVAESFVESGYMTYITTAGLLSSNENNLSSLYNKNLNIKYTPTAMVCSTTELSELELESIDFSPIDPGGYVLPVDPGLSTDH